jgi:hypothetical protein
MGWRDTSSAFGKIDGAACGSHRPRDHLPSKARSSAAWAMSDFVIEDG